MVSIKIRHRKLGGHVHADIFTSEFGPETTHGKNGSLIFRLTEWPAFMECMLTGHGALVQFIDDIDDEETED